MQPGRMTPCASELSFEGTVHVHSELALAPSSTIASSTAVAAGLADSETGSSTRLPTGGQCDSADAAATVNPGDALREVIGDEQFARWFHAKAHLKVTGEELLVRAGSPFHVNWIQKQFRADLGRVAQTLIGPHGRVRYEANTTGANTLTPASARPDVATGAPAEIAAELSRTGTAVTSASVSAKMVGAAAAQCEPQGSASDRAEQPVLRRRSAELADFVVGPGSELAVAAVRQLVAAPQSAPNPLYLYGATGIGKTHLLEATARQLRRQYPGLAVTSLTAEHFANLFTQALREHRLPGFRHRFRSIDVLIVDDVDFFDGKRGLQEEFLHTIQQLQTAGKLLVLSGDRHPRLLTKTGDELRSRIAAGLVCRIDSPDLTCRREIVRRKAAVWPDAVTPDALDYIADRFTSNVRELEGALHCLVSHHRLLGRRIGVGTARQALGELERDCVRVVRLVDIDNAVSALFGLEPEALKSANRSREVSQPRMLAMFLARNLTRCAYSEIGAYFGGRNHSTVIAAERRIAATVHDSESWRVASRQWAVGDLVETLKQQILAG